MVGAVLLAVPRVVNAGQLPYWSDALTQVILFLSLGLLVRTSGQVSLCQAAFAAIGATTMGHLTAGFGLSWGPRCCWPVWRRSWHRHEGQLRAA